MAYQVTLTHQAAKQLGKLTKSTAHDIGAKIAWLAQNIESIRHERLKGHEEYSLHSGGYAFCIHWITLVSWSLSKM